MHKLSKCAITPSNHEMHSVGRWIDGSVGWSVGRWDGGLSLCRSVGRWVDERVGGRWVGRWEVGLAVGQSIGQSFGESVGSALNHFCSSCSI